MDTTHNGVIINKIHLHPYYMKIHVCAKDVSQNTLKSIKKTRNRVDHLSNQKF